MAGRMPVGQVWIRVSPDTRGFAAETRRELKKMKSLDKYKVPIEVELDSAQVELDFAKTVQTLQRQAATKAYRVKIETELAWKQGDYRRQIRKQVEEYQLLADERRVEIKTNLDNDTFSSGSEYRPKITLDVDERRFQKDVEKLMADTKATIDVKVDRDRIRDEVKGAVSDVTKFFGQLAKRNKNVITVKAEKESLERAEEYLTRLQRHYDAAAENEQAARRELQRTTREYNAIRSKIGHIQNRMEALNRSAEDGAEEYAALAAKVERYSEALKAFDMERKRQMKVGRDAHIYVQANMDSIRVAEERVDQLRDRVEHIAADIEATTDKTSFTRVAAEIAALTRPRVVSIFTNVVNNPKWKRFWGQASDSASNINRSLLKYGTQIIGLRLLWKTMEDMVRIVPKLDMMIPGLAATSVAAVSAISGAGVLLTNLAGIVTDMARVFNLFLAAPAAAAAIGLQAWMLVSAYKDYENKVPEIAKDLHDLGGVLGDSVWQTSIDSIKGLHKALMPILKTRMPEWAKAVGKNVGALADGFRDIVKEGLADEFFKNAQKGSENATKGFKSFGSALLRLTAVGSRVLPDLGTLFTDVMDDFDKWVDRNSKNGNLERWIREGGAALRDLGSIFMSTLSIFRSFAGVARDLNLPTLTDFARGMATFADKISQTGGLDKFAGPLENMLGFVREFERIGPLLGESLATLWELAGRAASELKGPIVGAVEGILEAFNSSKFQDGMMSFFEDIGQFIEDITPGLSSLVGEFGSMAAIVGVAAKAWGPAFNEVLLMFEDLGKGMHPGLQSFLENVGPDLQKLVSDLRPEVEKLGTAIGDFLGDEDVQEFVSYMLESLGDIVGAALSAGAALLNAFQGFANWWAEQPEWFKNLSADLALIAVIALPVATGLMAIATVLKPLFVVGGLVVSAMSAIGGMLTWLWGKFKLTRLGAAIGRIADDLALRFLYFIDKLKKIPGVLLRGLGFVLKALGKVPGIILTALGKLPGALARGLGWIGRGLLSGITGLFRSIGSWKIWGNIGKFFAPLLKWIKGIPGALWKLLPKSGFAKLIRPILGRILGVLTGPVGWAWIIAELIRPVPILDFAKWVLDALGFGDSWAGRFVDSLNKSISMYIGRGSLVDWVLAPFKDAWGHFSEGDWIAGILDILFLGSLRMGGMLAAAIADALGFADIAEALRNTDVTATISNAISNFFKRLFGGDDAKAAATASADEAAGALSASLSTSMPGMMAKLQGAVGRAITWLRRRLATWKPTTKAGTFLHDLLERLPGLLGFNNDGTWSFATLTKSWTEFGTKLWKEDIQPWLKESWDKLIESLKRWEPAREVIEFFDDPLGKILDWLNVPDWLWNAGGTGIITTKESAGSTWGRRLWLYHILPWLVRGWDDLVMEVTNWKPVAEVIEFFKDPWGKIMEWLGIDEDFPGNVVTAGKAGLKGIAGWGKRAWDRIKPDLDGGWIDLTRGIGGWGPSGGDEPPSGGPSGPGITSKVWTWVRKHLFGDEEGQPTGGAVASGVRDAFGVLIPKTKTEFTGGINSLRESLRTPGGSGGEGEVEKALGLTQEAVQRAGAITQYMGGRLASMKNTAINEYNSMRTGVSGQLSGMSQETGLRADDMARYMADRARRMKNEVSGTTQDMKVKVESHFNGMKAKANDDALAMAHSVGGSFRGMRTNSVSDATGMSSGVAGQTERMRARAIADAMSTKNGMLAQLDRAKSGAIARARDMSSSYARQVSGMSAQSLSTASSMRSRLLAVLGFNASGSGRTVASSYRGGLSGGLSGALGAARGIAGRMRSALSFSAYSSGASIGSTFASGVRSRIGAAVSAASALAAAVRNRLPRSPAKEGPFSGSGWGGWGESIADELAKGLRSGAPEVAAEAQGLMRGVHDALDTKAEVGFGVSTRALNDAFAGAEIAVEQGRARQLSAADVENGVANGLARLIAPANDRDVVAIVRRANRNGAL